MNDRFIYLMERYFSADLTADEEKEFNELIESNADFKKEFEEQANIHEALTKMKIKEPLPEVWDKYWYRVYNRLERGIGWILFSIGLIILIATGGFYAIQSFLTNPDIPIPEKIGLSAFFLGSAVLIVSVLREKLTLRKTDKYKDIVR